MIKIIFLFSIFICVSSNALANNGHILIRSHFDVFKKVDFLLINSQGKRAGKDGITGEVYNEIPGVNYILEYGEGPTDSSIILQYLNAPLGEYTIRIFTPSKRTYKLDIFTFNRDGKAISAEEYSGFVWEKQKIPFSHAGLVREVLDESLKKEMEKFSKSIKIPIKQKLYSTYEQELDQTKWKALKNKDGWEIKYPPCFEAFGFKNSDPATSRSVTIMPKIGCPTEIDLSTGLSINMHITNARDPLKRQREDINNKESRDVSYIKGFVSTKKEKVYSLLYGFSPSKDASFFTQTVERAYMNCSKKCLDASVVKNYDPPLLASDLSKNKMPLIYEKILATYECTKP